MVCHREERQKQGLTICPVTSDSHRWSGWPGAYCMDCYIDDPTELCLADNCHCMDALWEEYDKWCEEHKNDEMGNNTIF